MLLNGKACVARNVFTKMFLVKPSTSKGTSTSSLIESVISLSLLLSYVFVLSTVLYVHLCYTTVYCIYYPTYFIMTDMYLTCGLLYYYLNVI